MFDDPVTFFSVVSAMHPGLVPPEDAQDLRDGSGHVPGEVTVARREGKAVAYDRVAKLWAMPDGRTVR